MRIIQAALACVALVSLAGSAGAQSTQGNSPSMATDPNKAMLSPGQDPKHGQIAGGGDPMLLKNGTGNSQSPAVSTGGPTDPSANPTSK